MNVWTCTNEKYEKSKLCRGNLFQQYLVHGRKRRTDDSRQVYDFHDETRKKLYVVAPCTSYSSIPNSHVRIRRKRRRPKGGGGEKKRKSSRSLFGTAPGHSQLSFKVGDRQKKKKKKRNRGGGRGTGEKIDRKQGQSKCVVAWRYSLTVKSPAGATSWPRANAKARPNKNKEILILTMERKGGEGERDSLRGRDHGRHWRYRRAT